MNGVVRFVAVAIMMLGSVSGVQAGGAEDCNGNGIPDECDISCGVPLSPCDVPGCGGSSDGNANGVPDECGACCGSSGECTHLLPSSCESSSGTYMGDDTACDEANCVVIPTVSEWGLAVMTLLTLAVGTLVYRRRLNAVAP